MKVAEYFRPSDPDIYQAWRHLNTMFREFLQIHLDAEDDTSQRDAIMRALLAMNVLSNFGPRPKFRLNPDGVAALSPEEVEGHAKIFVKNLDRESIAWQNIQLLPRTITFNQSDSHTSSERLDHRWAPAGSTDSFPKT